MGGNTAAVFNDRNPVHRFGGHQLPRPSMAQCFSSRSTHLPALRPFESGIIDRVGQLSIRIRPSGCSDDATRYLEYGLSDFLRCDNF